MNEDEGTDTYYVAVGCSQVVTASDTLLKLCARLRRFAALRCAALHVLLRCATPSLVITRALLRPTVMAHQ